MAVVNIAVKVPEEEVVRKQVGAGSNLDVKVPEEEVVEKQVGARCKRIYGGSEEHVERK